MNSLTSANLLACIFMIMQLVVALVLQLLHTQLAAKVPALFSTQALLFVNEFLAIFLPSLLFLHMLAKRTGKSISSLLRLNPLSGKNILFVTLMSLTIQPLMSILSVVAAFFYPNNISGVIDGLSESLPYPQMVLTLALVPAIFEELALRGAILAAYRKRMDFKHIALINGLFFSLMHLNGQQLLYTLAIGIFLAYLVEKTDSLFASIIAHFTINFSQTTMVALLTSFASSPTYRHLMDEAEKNAPAVEAAGQGVGLEEIYAIAVLIASSLAFIFAAFALFRIVLKKFQELNAAHRLTEPTYSGHFAPTIAQQLYTEHGPAFFATLGAAVLLYLSYILLFEPSLPQLIFIGCYFVGFFFLFFLFRFRR